MERTVGCKSTTQTIWDFVGMPFRLLLFDQAWLPRCGWTTLEEERIAAVLPHIRGRLLDVGAGQNNLVKRCGQGIGVDVFDWGGGAMVVEDTSSLPFDDCSFDTVSLLACLNHIPYREAALREAKRLLAPHGRLIITMINPVFGSVGHAVWWYSEDKRRGGMRAGEVGGLWTREINRMCQAAGFRLQMHRRFVYGMNHLYVFEVVGGAPGS